MNNCVSCKRIFKLFPDLDHTECEIAAVRKAVASEADIFKSLNQFYGNN